MVHILLLTAGTSFRGRGQRKKENDGRGQTLFFREPSFLKARIRLWWAENEISRGVPGRSGTQRDGSSLDSPCCRWPPVDGCRHSPRRPVCLRGLRIPRPGTG